LPSNVQASEEISVRSKPSKCFEFFTDLTNIGSCIPGCEQVTPIDSTSAIFKVRLKLGYISRTFELKARLLDQRADEHLSFTAEGSDAEIKGIVDLNSEGKTKEYESTIVKYNLEIRPISVTGKTAISMIGKDLVRRQASEFATCVKSKLES
jgi:carbon monoxide dehydrogenase subunit G